MAVHSVLHLIMYLMCKVKHPLYLRNRHTIVTVDRLWSSVSMLQAPPPPAPASAPTPLHGMNGHLGHAVCFNRVFDPPLCCPHSITGMEALERLCSW